MTNPNEAPSELTEFSDALDQFELEVREHQTGRCGLTAHVTEVPAYRDQLIELFKCARPLPVEQQAPCKNCGHEQAEHVLGHGCTARIIAEGERTGPECECVEFKLIEQAAPADLVKGMIQSMREFGAGSSKVVLMHMDDMPTTTVIVAIGSEAQRFSDIYDKDIEEQK